MGGDTECCSNGRELLPDAAAPLRVESRRKALLEEFQAGLGLEMRDKVASEDLA